MILVEKWLHGSRNYTAGCILYNQYGKDDVVKQLLSKGESVSNKEQLAAALAALIAPEEKAEIPTEESFKKMPTGADAVSESIHADWKQHYTAMNMLRGKLESYGDDNSPEAVAECNGICQEILGHERYITACWEKLRHYQEHGKLPEETDEKFEIPADAIALGKLIETLKRNIRRNKMKAAAEPSNPLYPSLVKKYEDRLKQIQDT